MIKSGHKLRFRHFKGGIFEVDMVATDSKDHSTLRFVYHSTDDLGTFQGRPADMFLSEVDHEKYPDVTQKYRFELLDN